MTAPIKLPNVLEQIMIDKRKSVAEAKKRRPLAQLIEEAKSAPQVPRFLQAVFRQGRLGIVAEMKRQSPSAGPIVEHYDPARLAKTYAQAGSAAISVLTEEQYFLGSPEHLQLARKASGLPVLRKDFIFDPYQVYETKAMGASAVLLIAALLDAVTLSELHALARELGLEAIVEVHDDKDLAAALVLKPGTIGINNRNLKDLSVDLATTFKLLPPIPRGTCVIAESGIQSPDTVRELRAAGVNAALIGESILKSSDPGTMLRAFVEAGGGRP